MLGEVLRKLLPSLNEEALFAVWGVLCNPFWNAPPPISVEGVPSIEAQRELYSFVSYEGKIGRALRAMPIGLERSILAELHTQVRIQLRAGIKSGLVPDVQGPSQSTEGEPLPGGGEEISISTPEPVRREVARFPGEEKDPLEVLKRRDVESRPALGRALLTVRLSLESAEYQPTLKIEVGRGGVWEDIYWGTFRPFNSFVSVYNFQMPLSLKVSPPELIRFTVWGAGRKGILYAWISFHAGTLQLHSPSEVARESDDPSSVLVDYNGLGIYGVPNSLRKASEGFEDDRSVITMTLV